jgi:2-polyprenyl-3-methyl-5-hydroxy-6-metoxy-1,4-benzoquinol methylase
MLLNSLRLGLRKVRLWYETRVVWDNELISDLMEFFDLTYNETIQLLKVGKKVFNMTWTALEPKTEEEILKFYETVPFNVFSLAYWHMRKHQRKFRQQVIEHCSGKVLDYGGGIGDLCIELAKRGFDVTYGDVKGKNMEFAKWRFMKKGLNVKVIDLVRDHTSLEEYDTILCIDVIEHVPDPKNSLKTIGQHLKTNGKLIITKLTCLGPTKENPCHRKIDFDAKQLLNLLGIFQTKNEWLWIKRTNGN